jgi:hypothetical protein
MIRSLLFVALAAVMAACATAQPTYVPAAGAGAGYSETQIESNRYFVTYRAGGAADAALVQDYALLRAAELTLQAGRSWFWVDRRSLDQQDTRGYGGPSVGVGIGAGGWGGHSGASVGVNVNLPVGGGGAGRARSATLEIRFGEGAKPDDPNAYDAHAIAANIRARRMH